MGSQEVSSSSELEQKRSEVCRGTFFRLGVVWDVATDGSPRYPVYRWNRQRALLNGVQPSCVCLVYSEILRDSGMTDGGLGCSVLHVDVILTCTESRLFPRT